MCGELGTCLSGRRAWQGCVNSGRRGLGRRRAGCSFWGAADISVRAGRDTQRRQDGERQACVRGSACCGVKVCACCLALAARIAWPHCMPEAPREAPQRPLPAPSMPSTMLTGHAEDALFRVNEWIPALGELVRYQKQHAQLPASAMWVNSHCQEGCRFSSMRVSLDSGTLDLLFSSSQEPLLVEPDRGRGGGRQFRTPLCNIPAFTSNEQKPMATYTYAGTTITRYNVAKRSQQRQRQKSASA